MEGFLVDISAKTKDGSLVTYTEVVILPPPDKLKIKPSRRKGWAAKKAKVQLKEKLPGLRSLRVTKVEPARHIKGSPLLSDPSLCSDPPRRPQQLELGLAV